MYFFYIWINKKKPHLFSANKEIQTGLMLDTDYLLKLDKEGQLTYEFLSEVKLYLAKKNQDTQDKLNFLAIQQKKTYESVNHVISETKKQVEEDGQNILSRVKAEEYIKYYKRQFQISQTESNGYMILGIKFPEKPVEEPGSPIRIKTKHATIKYSETIEEFIKEMVKYKEVNELISTGEDNKRVGAVYKEYMHKLHDTLINDNVFFKELSNEANLDKSMELRERIYQEIEAHVGFELYAKSFAKQSSIQDSAFCRKMRLIQWIDPVLLGVKSSDLKVDYWKSACEDIHKMESARTPRQKLDNLMHCVNLISQGLMKFSNRKDPPGADDLTPIFNYIIIMSAPRMIYSNLKYFLI